MRWFELPVELAEIPPYLDVICYNKSQSKEASAAGKDWSIVSVKACHVNYELPMAPITMMRNTISMGVELKNDEYMKSVEFWEKHALVR